MNIEQSKKLSIIDFLDKENVTLKKKKGNAYWYLSPFRDEKTASFKVSKKENLCRCCRYLSSCSPHGRSSFR